MIYAFQKKGNLRAVLYWKRFVIGWKIVNISVEMVWEKVVWKSELGFQMIFGHFFFQRLNA